ncbi:MAG: response regulator, partial [Proteobacteria bacterium]|nr:response regulator [Pseudomonadota bacterium]
MPDSPLPRILIVDDEAAQMRALCDTLRDQGYETVGFTDGKTALDALSGTRFELLLADMMMPGMDGITLLHAAQRTDPDLVGIIMTGEGTIATAVEAMKTGALDYILKPFKLSAILPVLARALAVRHLRIANAELEHSVRERTTELETANKELEAFAYSVSHDLRAPLTVVLGCADLLLEDHMAQLPPRAQQLVKEVDSGAVRMRQLIDDLLRLSRLGRQPLSKLPINVSALVREVLEEVQKEQGGRRVEVRVGDLPDSVGDPGLLKQVFANLLSNAFKFTRGRERPVVEVMWQQVAGEKVYSVRDNGAGFDMRQAKDLFGAFHR